MSSMKIVFISLGRWPCTRAADALTRAVPGPDREMCPPIAAAAKVLADPVLTGRASKSNQCHRCHALEHLLDAMLVGVEPVTQRLNGRALLASAIRVSRFAVTIAKSCSGTDDCKRKRLGRNSGTPE